MVNRRVSRVPMSLLILALALLFVGCADERTSAPALISIDSDQVTWQSTEGSLWGITDVLARGGLIWVLSPVEPFVHGLRHGTEMVAVTWGSDLWTATLVRTTADGNVERLVDFGDLQGAFHEQVRTRSVLVPVPLWDACPDGSVVVLDPMARFLYRIDSTWEERDSLFVPWDVPPLTRADRINYLKGQMKAELQRQSVEASEMEAMLARAEEGGRDQFPAAAPLAVDLKCSEGQVWMQEYDGAAHPPRLLPDVAHGRPLG